MAGGCGDTWIQFNVGETMRCSMCGHESPAGSSFCLNCGSSLAQAYAPTQIPAPGLPSTSVCGVCRGENPAGMKFCRSCGSALQPIAGLGTDRSGLADPRGAFPAARPGPPPGPMPASQAALGGPMPGMQSGPIGGFPQVPPSGAFTGLAGRGADALQPTIMPASNPAIAAPMPAPMAPMPAMPAPRLGQGSTIACPRCGTQTPVGFAFCQQCGLHWIRPLWFTRLHALLRLGGIIVELRREATETNDER